MADLNTITANTFGNFFKGITWSSIATTGSWIVFGLIIIGMGVYGYWVFMDRKKYGAKIVIHELINGYFDETSRDRARNVKIGKGGFIVLFLKKNKSWKLAYGGKSGRNTYNFYIMPDGYWYNGSIAGNVHYMDKNGGLIPIVTTNPAMRAQYTSLEKQIDDLHTEKKGFWVVPLTFIIIMGFFGWMMFREMAPFLGKGTELAGRMTDLADQMNKLAVNLNNINGNNGLVKASG